jgi:preprotein translocase subunit YajC
MPLLVLFSPTPSVLAAAEPAGPAGPLELLITYLPMVLIVFAAWFLLYRPERERMRRQRELLDNVKKNDRVLTNAGVYGTVSSVDREHDRLVLKVDEGSNTKLTFTLGSISRVLTDTDTGEAEGGRA